MTKSSKEALIVALIDATAKTLWAFAVYKMANNIIDKMSDKTHS